MFIYNTQINLSLPFFTEIPPSKLSFCIVPLKAGSYGFPMIVVLHQTVYYPYLTILFSLFTLYLLFVGRVLLVHLRHLFASLLFVDIFLFHPLMDTRPLGTFCIIFILILYFFKKKTKMLIKSRDISYLKRSSKINVFLQCPLVTFSFENLHIVQSCFESFFWR